jgi:hypothetical protein
MPAAVTFVWETSSSCSEGLCRREDMLVIELQLARFSFVNVAMHSSPAMPASVTLVQSKMSSRNAVTKAGDRGDLPAVRQVQHLQRGDPLQSDDAHVSHRRVCQLQFPQRMAACQRSHIVNA